MCPRVLLGISLMAAAVVAATAGTPCKTDACVRSQFEEFKLQFRKSYATVDEEENRFQVFQNTLERIAGLNEDLDTPVFGITKFSDLTPEEFQLQKFGTPKLLGQADYPAAPVRQPPPGFAPPTSVDWRTKGVVGKVRDQGSCGNCWAHSATEEIESSWAMATNKTLVPLSVQQITSCDLKDDWPCPGAPCKNMDDGCDGGDPPFAVLYVCNQTHSLATEEAYPSKSPRSGDTLKCEKDAQQIPVPCTGYSWALTPCPKMKSCPSQNETLAKWNLAAYGPLSISVDANNGWQDYNRGIFPGNRCKDGMGQLDHSVQLVGYGDENGKEYWLVRNSWAADWGEDGYIRLEFGTNACGVVDEALFVDFPSAPYKHF